MPPRTWNDSASSRSLLAKLSNFEANDEDVRTSGMQDRTLSGAHLLDWIGHDREVTFYPTQFDEHPNTLRLLSFGSDLLKGLLESIESPEASGRAARCLGLEAPARRS